MIKHMSENNSKPYLWVPVEMCLFSLQNKFYRPLRLYLYLNLNTSGLSKLDKKFRKNASTFLNITGRTFYRNLEPLLSRNWIGQNPATGTYFIRGFESIRTIEGLYSRSAAKLHPSFLEEPDRIQGFCLAAIIGYRIYTKKREGRRLNKNSDVHSRTSNLPLLMACSATYLSKILGLSVASCHRLKQLADHYNYINIKENIDHIEIDPSSLWGINTYLDYDNGAFYKISRNRMVHEIVKPDLVSSNLVYATRAKINCD